MSVSKFGSFKLLKESKSDDTDNEAANDGGKPRRARPRATVTGTAAINDGDRFLRIAEKTSRITRHRELYELLQSDDIQRFIPHQIFISAWGNFDGPDPRCDLISALPGVRTSMLKHCTMDGMLRVFYKRWLVEARQPVLIKSSRHAQLEYSGCECALHKFLQGKWSMLVHGVTNARDGEVSLYMALHTDPIAKGSIERFYQLVDPLVTQTDVPFRRIAALRSPSLPDHDETTPSLPQLSPREKQILAVVAEGKSNSKASQVLGISQFTVKSHMQRIMQKLGARNRTEAVAKYREMRRQEKTT